MPRREPAEKCRWCDANCFLAEDYLCDGRCEDEDYEDYDPDQITGYSFTYPKPSEDDE